MKAETATITVNGERRSVELPCLMIDFLASSGWRDTQVVVEHNGKVIPRIHVGELSLGDGDQIEVIVPVAGG